MTRRGRLQGALVATALLLAPGCAATTAGGAAEDEGQLSVVTAAYPFQFVAARVAGPHAAVSTLTSPGTEPHDLELSPKQVASLAAADLVVYEQSFQPAVDEAVQQSGTDRALDTTTVVPLQELGSAPEEDTHADEAGHQHESSHEHGGLDPHVWLDPRHVATVADAVAARLAAVDAAHASAYAANAEALRAELTRLDQAFAAGLADCARREFITTHAAFGYLATRYDLNQIAVSGISPDAEPSPARIAAVQAEARDHGVTTIFTETLVSPAVAETIAGDLGLRADVLDPIEGITPQSRRQDYLSVMRANLAALQEANGCR